MTQTALLGEVAEFISGFAFRSSAFNVEGVGMPLVRIRDVVPGTSGTYYSGEYDKRFVVEDGDYLIGMDGEFNLARWRGGRALLNQRVCKVAELDSGLDRGYLGHFLPGALKAIEDVTPFATVKHLSVKSLRQIEIPLPPLDEQRRMAAILDQADALRAKRRLALVHLDELSEAIFHDMFGGLDSGATLGEMAEIQGGLQVSAKRASLPIEVPYLRVANAHRGRLELAEVKTLRATAAEIDRTILLDGDLLFVEGHANPQEVGRVAMWSGEVEGCVHQNHLIRGRLDRSRILPIFASTWLNTDRGASHFRRAGRTTSGLNTISATTVRSAPIPVPPIEQQRDFVERVGLIDIQRTKARRALDAGAELFSVLRSRAFRGEL